MTKELKYAVVIPARYKSSRFPGKPLVDLCGKTMIQHVWERCCLAVPSRLVYIATDSDKIRNAASKFGAKVIMTSEHCLTGTDRLGEANAFLNCDFIVNVQGDEPLIEPEVIRRVVATYMDNQQLVVNAMCKIADESEFRSLSIPKVVASKSNTLLYMSRSPIPGNKLDTFDFGYKQVCVYAFSSEHLKFFCTQRVKTPLEESEDIEILRFVENDIQVKMVEVDASSIAVDFPSDVDKVIRHMKSLSNS